MDLALTLVIQGVVFFLVAWAVMKFIWPGIMCAIETRQKKIAEGLAAAAKSQKDLGEARGARQGDHPRGARQGRADPRPGGQALQRDGRRGQGHRIRRSTAPGRAGARGGGARELARTRGAAPRGRQARRGRRLAPARARDRSEDPRGAAGPAGGRDRAMAERATIARPYAKAAFELRARREGALPPGRWACRRPPAIVADPRVAAPDRNPELPRPTSPDWSRTSRASEFDQGMRNFVRVLAENHRLVLLPEIAAHYEAQRARVENTVDVEVVSAVPLDAAQSAKLSTALGKRLRPQRAHEQFGRSGAARRRRHPRRRHGHRRFAQGPPAAARHRLTAEATGRIPRG